MAFLGVGVFWLVAAVSGEGPIQLLLPALASLVTGGLLRTRRVGWLRGLLVASGLYNAVIFGYQAFASYVLVTLGLPFLGGVALVGYALGALLFLGLTLYGNLTLRGPPSAPAPSAG